MYEVTLLSFEANPGGGGVFLNFYWKCCLEIAKEADEWLANFSNHDGRIQAVAGIQCNQLHTCAS